MTEVRRSSGCDSSATAAQAERVALALMGVGALAGETLAEAATWDFTGGAVTGRAAVRARAAAQSADMIAIDQVVAHGRGGSVTGRVTRGGDTRLFCHVIRFTSVSATQIAQLVSFEHPGGA